MRVALISSGYFPVLDGVTVTVHERIRRLTKSGHEVLLLAPQADGGGTHTLMPGATLIGLASQPWGGAAKDRNPLPAANTQIDTALNRFQPDLIHVEEPERLFLGLRRIPGHAFARRHGTPLLAFYHTNFVDYLADTVPAAARPLISPVQALGRRAIAMLFNRFDTTLVPSTTGLRRLERAGLRNGVAGRFNGVDTSVFRPDLRRAGYWGEVWGLPSLDELTVIAIVGRLTADKNWRFWRACLPALQAQAGGQAAIVIAGDGALATEIRDWLPLAQAAHLLGNVDRARMPALMANADLYATASLRENASIAALEALAAGTPVLAPDIDGMREQIADGRTGRLFAPNDVKSFLAAATTLRRSDDLLRGIRRQVIVDREELGWERAFAAWWAAVSAAQGRSRRPRG